MVWDSKLVVGVGLLVWDTGGNVFYSAIKVHDASIQVVRMDLQTPFRSFCSKWLCQTRALAAKQLKVTTHRLISASVRLFLPALVLITLWIPRQRLPANLLQYYPNPFVLAAPFVLSFAFSCSATVVQFGVAEERRLHLLGIL